MDRIYVDINSDVGEGVGNEEELLPLISSCSIACGGHVGNNQTMLKTVQLAHQNGVKIGAHPSYPDKVNFGRISMAIPEEELIESIEDQIISLKSILINKNIPLHHIKPHGALYNELTNNLHLSQLFLTAVNNFKEEAFLCAPFGSCIAKEAIRQGFKVRKEAFADRNYNVDSSLVSRKLPNALIKDPEQVLEHLIRMLHKKKVTTVEGVEIPIVADTFCIHGDTPSALRILHYLSTELPKYNIHIKK